VDTATLWPAALFAVKLIAVAAMALMIAVSLWLLEHTLRQGATPETKPGGPIYTRSTTPWRYGLFIARKLMFVAAIAVLIHAVIHLGRAPAQPAAAVQEEKPHAPARANDEAYDRS